MEEVTLSPSWEVETGDPGAAPASLPIRIPAGLSCEGEVTQRVLSISLPWHTASKDRALSEGLWGEEVNWSQAFRGE